MIYHFLVESKPHERIDLSITANRQKKKKKSIPIVMKACFSEEKLIKQFGPPSLSSNHLFLSNFFMTPSLSKF